MLDALAQGNGLLLKRGPNTYAFPHRTFKSSRYHLKSQRDYCKLCLQRASQVHCTRPRRYGQLPGTEDRELEKPPDLAEKLLTW